MPRSCSRRPRSNPMNTDIGAFRTVCDFSHMAFDDPIVYPGQAGRSHLHAFFGNSGTDANSTAESIAGSGNSTCRGGTINRTAYWAPAVIDTRDGTPVKPDVLIAYYKTGYRGIAPAAVQPMPAGLRMIAGDSKAQRAQSWRTGDIHLHVSKYRHRPPDGRAPNHLPGRQHDLGHRDVSAMLGRRPSGFAGPQESHGLPDQRRLPCEPPGAFSGSGAQLLIHRHRCRRTRALAARVGQLRHQHSGRVLACTPTGSTAGNPRSWGRSFTTATRRPGTASRTSLAMAR